MWRSDGVADQFPPKCAISWKWNGVDRIVLVLVDVPKFAVGNFFNSFDYWIKLNDFGMKSIENVLVIDLLAMAVVSVSGARQ